MTVDEHVSKYVTELQPLYKQFSGKVEELVCSILKAHNISPHSVTSREKSAISLREKITREGKSYDDPLHQITDLAGVRVITFFPSDVDRVGPALEKEFVVDRANSIDKRQVSDPSAFGYASVHLVVQLAPKRAGLPEYSTFADLKCEIQVRTILQHAWAEIEHDFVYKSNDEVPFELRRQFASLAGLLEVADREFEMLRHLQAEVRTRIQATLHDNRLDLPVDLDSLTFYLQQYHQRTTVNPKKVGRLVKFLSEYKVKTIQELHNILSKSALQRGRQSEIALSELCREAESCLARYFLAVGSHFHLSDETVGSLFHCPALTDPKAFKQRRTREIVHSSPNYRRRVPLDKGGGSKA